MSVVSRSERVAEIQRTRLGGISPITIDDPGTPPYKRYAHIMSNEMGTNLYTTDEPDVIDPAYRVPCHGSRPWKLDAVIDLDTGEVVE